MWRCCGGSSFCESWASLWRKSAKCKASPTRWATGCAAHLVTLEREQENLAAAARLCAGLTECREKLETLDAQALLEQMDEMEQRGTTFQNKQRLDIRFRYVAPVVITLLTVALMGSIGALMAWGYVQDAESAPPLAVVVALAAIPAAVAAACCWHWSSGSGKSEGGNWMKRGNSDKRWKRRAAPIAAAILVIVFVLPLAAVGILAALDLIQIGENLAALLFLLFYAVTGLAVALGVLVAMRQRLRELDRGEEDDAKKY